MVGIRAVATGVMQIVLVVIRFLSTVPLLPKSNSTTDEQICPKEVVLLFNPKKAKYSQS